MRYAARLTMAIGVVGAVAFASAAAGSSDTSEGPEIDALPISDEQRDPGLRMQRGQMLSSQRSFLNADGEVVTIFHDRGEVAAVDGDSLTIERADGERLVFEISEETRIRRNGEEASLSDLEQGDRVMVLRVDDEEGERVVGVRAGSGDFDGDRKHRPRARGHGPRFGGPGWGGPMQDAPMNEAEATFVG